MLGLLSWRRRSLPNVRPARAAKLLIEARELAAAGYIVGAAGSARCALEAAVARELPDAPLNARTPDHIAQLRRIGVSPVLVRRLRKSWQSASAVIHGRVHPGPLLIRRLVMLTELAIRELNGQRPTLGDKIRALAETFRQSPAVIGTADLPDLPDAADSYRAASDLAASGRFPEAWDLLNESLRECLALRHPVVLEVGLDGGTSIRREVDVVRSLNGYDRWTWRTLMRVSRKPPVIERRHVDILAGAVHAMMREFALQEAAP